MACIRLSPARLVKPLLAVALCLAAHSQAAAQQRPRPLVPVPAPAEVWAAAPLTPPLESVERRAFLSARGAAIGAAVGCLIGGAYFYRNTTQTGSRRVAWGAAGCALISIPGAYFGGVWID